MSTKEYTEKPDNWVLLKIKTSEETLYKILAGWYSGFTEGNSWKISSAIKRIEEGAQGYYFYNESGSIYYCGKSRYGFSITTASIANNFEVTSRDSGISLTIARSKKEVKDLIQEIKNGSSIEQS
jgi:hypothetical protein